MHKASIPEVYKRVVDDVIANCSMISKKKLNSIILVKLRDLWLSKLEAQGDEYIDLNYLQPQEKTKGKSIDSAKKKLPNNKCELVCRVQLKAIKYPEICSNLSMPILDDDTIPQNLQSVICNKSESVSLKPKKLEEKIEHEQPTYKKHEMKCEVKSLIKTESEARRMCSNVNVNDKLAKTCMSPIVLLTMENNLKSKGTTKSDLSLFKSTRRVGKHRDNTCLKPTLQNCRKKKFESKLKQQIPKSTNNKVEIEKSKVAKTKIQRRVNSPALLKKQFQVDLENIKENTTGLKKYNYVYKNKEPCEKNKFGYTPVKIILPHRTGYSIKQRTCIVDAPSWFLVGSRLPRLLSPLIKQVTDLALSDAKSTLQQCINNYNNMLQVDGAGVKFNLRSVNYNNGQATKQSIKDTSDIDSNDDETDDEDINAAFQSDNSIMCKFSLIKQSKLKWKLLLHNGIVYVNNKVFMFNSAVGTVEW